MSYKAIEKMLADAGVKEVISIREAMKITGLCYATIFSAIEHGKLQKLDRGVIARESFIRWILSKPRYLPKLYKGLETLKQPCGV